MARGKKKPALAKKLTQLQKQGAGERLGFGDAERGRTISRSQKAKAAKLPTKKLPTPLPKPKPEAWVWDTSVYPWRTKQAKATNLKRQLGKSIPIADATGERRPDRWIKKPRPKRIKE